MFQQAIGDLGVRRRQPEHEHAHDTGRGRDGALVGTGAEAGMGKSQQLAGRGVVFDGDDESGPIEKRLRQYEPLEQVDRHRLREPTLRRLTAPDFRQLRRIAVTEAAILDHGWSIVGGRELFGRCKSGTVKRTLACALG